MDANTADSPCTAIRSPLVGDGWYCVQTATRNERRVQQALERLGYATMLFLVEVKAGPRYSSLRNLIPPYVLVRFDPRRDAWAEIREIEGVNRIVGNSHDLPVSIPPDVIGPLAMACALDLYDIDRSAPAEKAKRSRKPRNQRRIRRSAHRLKRWLRANLAKGH